MSRLAVASASGLILPFGGVRPRIDPDAFIAPNATVIGDTEIGAGSGIWFGCVLRGDVHAIRVGRNTNIQDGTVLHVTHKRHGTTIGDNVTIGHLALIHGCVLEDACFIGMHATVMDACVVETGGMVAAGALLPPGKRVRRGELWGGNPAKPMRTLSDEEMANFLHVAEHYAELARSYRRELAATG